MKHLIVVSEEEASAVKRHAAAERADGSSMHLIEAEYTPQETEAFTAAQSAWIIRRKGSQLFYADTDGGEDHRAYYCSYFDPVPEHAVFEGGRLIGFCLCPGDLDYDKYFKITNWGYPGHEPFDTYLNSYRIHVFLFEDEASQEWKEWTDEARAGCRLQIASHIRLANIKTARTRGITADRVRLFFRESPAACGMRRATRRIRA